MFKPKTGVTTLRYKCFLFSIWVLFFILFFLCLLYHVEMTLSNVTVCVCVGIELVKALVQSEWLFFCFLFFFSFVLFVCLFLNICLC